MRTPDHDGLDRGFVLTPRPAERPIPEPVTKLGGQPVWIEQARQPGVVTGGRPDWLQGDESPGPDWPLLLQIDATRVNFAINCGDAGMAYALLNAEQDGGVFLVQSC